MSEERPVKLHFFARSTVNKLLALCKKQGIKVNLAVEEDDSKWECWVTTEPLTSTRRRELISKWADVSMERITETNKDQ